MASKAQQWKRLHGLMLDPELVYAVTLKGGTWVTDRYVLVDLGAAQQYLQPEPGTWRLRASGAPVLADSSAGELSPKAFQQKIDQLAALDWQPADVTEWALVGVEGTWRLLAGDDEPVLMDGAVIRRWPEAFPEKADTVTWHTARLRRSGRQPDARVARATLRHDFGAAAKCGPSEHVFGYLMGTERQSAPLPPFPKLVTP